MYNQGVRLCDVCVQYKLVHTNSLAAHSGVLVQSLSQDPGFQSLNNPSGLQPTVPRPYTALEQSEDLHRIQGA